MVRTAGILRLPAIEATFADIEKYKYPSRWRGIFFSTFLKSKRLVIGDTKGFINGKALSYEGHTHDLATYSSNGFMSSDDKLALTTSTAYQYCTTYGTESSSSGFYKINILGQNLWMYAFTIRLYQSYTYYDIVISGYNYGIYHWYSPAATLIGSTGDSIQVHFGYDSDYNLWVAIPAGNYTGLTISNIANGFYRSVPQFTSTKVSSIPSTLQTSVTAYRPANINELNKYALASTVSTLSTKISKMEANVDMATLVASGYFTTSIKYSNNSSYVRKYFTLNLMYNGTKSTASTTIKNSDIESSVSGTISPVACSYIIFKYTIKNYKEIPNNTTTFSGVQSESFVEYKIKAGSTIYICDKDYNSSIIATLSSDGKTVTIVGGDLNTVTKNEIMGPWGWYECYA